MEMFPATRSHGEKRLARLLEGPRPRRQQVPGCDQELGEFGLSPYLRHRLLVESEVAEALIDAHGPEAAGALIDELCEMTCARAWLERHPGALRHYVLALGTSVGDLERNGLLQRSFDRATAGQTGIACFDAWTGECQSNGILPGHLHRAFASIWIFTLGLPWPLGAAFMIESTIDADLAVVLRLWRRVAGLEPGAGPFLVTGDGISRLTAGRYQRTVGLATIAGEAADEAELPMVRPATHEAEPGSGPAVLLATTDDLHLESWPVAPRDVRGIICIEPIDLYGWFGTQSHAFKNAALDDAMRRAAGHFDCPVLRLSRDEAIAGPELMATSRADARQWFVALDAPALIAMAPAIGPGQDDVAAVCRHLSDLRDPPRLVLIRRRWDSVFMDQPTDRTARMAMALAAVGR